MLEEAILTTSGSGFAVSYLTEDSYKSGAGRRDFVAYRNIGTDPATEGRVGASFARLSTGVHQSTGWHYHTCDIVFYVIDGWLEAEFADSGVLHLGPGTCVTLPKGLIHNEIRASADLNIFEVTVPAQIDTVPVEPPHQTTE